MAKRRGPYKRYLEGGKIPRSTQYRWNLAKKREEAGMVNDENGDGVEDTLQNMCPNLEEDDGWISVKWKRGKNHGEPACFPAKVLMLGDNYTDQKREEFIKGEDIWKKTEDKDRGGKRKIKPNSRWMENEDEENPRQSKQQKTKKATCPAKDLKKDLMALESTTEYEDSSEDDLLSRNWSKAQLQIKRLMAENKRLKEAMRELPAVVQQLKDITEQFSLTSSSASAESTPVGTPVRSEPLPLSAPASPQVESVDMVSLVPGSDVKVPKQKLNGLRTSNYSVYIADLALLVYGRETLSCSSLTGRQSGAHKEVESKPQLDGTKLDAILGHAMSKFPGISVQDVRRIIRRKCNNESYKKAAAKKTMDI